MNWNLVYGCLSLLSYMTSVGFGAYLLHDLENQRARYLIFLVAGTGVWAGTYAMDPIASLGFISNGNYSKPKFEGYLDCGMLPRYQYIPFEPIFCTIFPIFLGSLDHGNTS